MAVLIQIEDHMMHQDVIAKLLTIPSVSGSEDAIQSWIAQTLTHLGGKPVLVGKNIVLYIPGGMNTTALIFNAHVDTVPVGNGSSWQFDPYAGVISKGKIYGVGASDDKSAVAAFIMLAAHYLKIQPACDTWFMFVVNEEIDGSGSSETVGWFMKKYYKSYDHVAAVIGEPTYGAHIGIGHKGNVFLRVTTHGDSGHGSKPQRIKKHAIWEMFKVADTLRKLENEWIQTYSDPVLGSPSIGSLTSISAGSVMSPNKFPDTCVGTFDIRTTPKLHAHVLTLVQRAFGKYVAVEYAFPPVGCGFTDPKGLIVKAARNITKSPVGVFAMGSSDMPFFTAATIPAILFGPGNPACCHGPNEYCEPDKIASCVRVYKEMINAYTTLCLN